LGQGSDGLTNEQEYDCSCIVPKRQARLCTKRMFVLETRSHSINSKTHGDQLGREWLIRKVCQPPHLGKLTGQTTMSGVKLQVICHTTKTINLRSALRSFIDDGNVTSSLHRHRLGNKPDRKNLMVSTEPLRLP
jgi:hypothetical protein